jgi:hypothetical protein
MTEEQFNVFVNEDIPCALFHVQPTDIDDDSGAKLEEVILVKIIAENLSCLKYKPLQWFINTYLEPEKMQLN